jgi:hypothetical protein
MEICRGFVELSLRHWYAFNNRVFLPLEVDNLFHENHAVTQFPLHLNNALHKILNTNKLSVAVIVTTYIPESRPKHHHRILESSKRVGWGQSGSVQVSFECYLENPSTPYFQAPRYASSVVLHPESSIDTCFERFVLFYSLGDLSSASGYTGLNCNIYQPKTAI